MNPAIDRNVTVDKLVFDDRAYILSSHESAGGRGLNASCVVHSFGMETVAVAISGGRAGRRLEQLLGAGCTYTPEVVRVRNEIRNNFTIADRSGLAVKLNEKGPELSATELQKVEKAVKTHLKQARWLMLCGSLPPGVPADFYARLVHRANRDGVPVLVDADGQALEAALAERPTVVTPNQQEAERLLDRALLTRGHFLEAVQHVRAMGARAVVLSLGSRGATAARESEGAIEVIPPRVEALCPIGAGDALAAAFVWAMALKDDFADAVRWGVAAGSASARLPGVSFATLEQTRSVYERVEVRAAG
ncbi:MAG: hexose kinase [Bryobacteraceae bacterium]|nr:hexose kinase [Bryobacteraceae bacterium]